MPDRPPPTTHYLKTWPAYFEQVANGNKTFEIRKNDRGFQKGDIVVLAEYEPPTGVFSGKYTGEKLSAEIGYVTPFEQKEGFVVFSLLDVDGYSGD